MTKHSPDPFTAEYAPFVNQAGREIPSFRIHDANGDPVAETDSGKPHGQQEADAGVMAAAPDLLEALEQAVAALNTAPRFPVPSLPSDSYRIAAVCDRAIRKAKGGAA